MNKINLEDIFMKLQNQMIAQLSTNREIIKHPSVKGDAAELNWIKMLNTYLPKRYKVDKAFLIDSDGKLSEQIDVVIYDQQYSPFLFHQDEAKYIPAESVYAVFEVKQTMNNEMIKYAGKKTKSVRRLKRTSAPIIHAGGKYEPKKHFEILAGILSLTSDWQPPLGEPFSTSLESLELLERLNLGCVLQCGGFEIFYEDNTEIKRSQEKDSLIFFFLSLLKLLQQFGTAPAMDIEEYGKSIMHINK